EGPWEYKGRLNDLVPNSPTNHQAIVEYKNRWYFVYHNGNLPQGGEFRRSVCIDYLNYNDDGTIQKIIQTDEGVSKIAP
ncbi:MAG: glycoside hydrolase, partial [Marinoscillum sp.]